MAINNNNISENINRSQILLTNFEDFPQTATLFMLRSEMRIITTSIRQHITSKEIYKLVDEIIFIISAIIENTLEINQQILDTIHHSFNLFFTCLTNDNYSKINNVTSCTIKYYITLLYPITSKISLLKKTNYLQFPELNSTEIPKKYTGDELVYKFKKEIERQTKKIDIAISQIEKNESTKTTKNLAIPAISTNDLDKTNIKNNSLSIQQHTNNQLPDIQKIIQLLFLLENITTSAINTSVQLQPNQIDILTKGNEALKMLISDKPIKLFDIFNTNFKEIDTHIHNLHCFTEHKPNSNKKDENKTRQVSYSQLFDISTTSLNINQLLNYSNTLYQDIDFIFNNISKLSSVITSLKMSNNLDIIYQNKIVINSIINVLNRNISKFDKIEKIIKEKFLLANSLSKKLFNEIAELGSKKFLYFTIGLENFMNLILEKYKKRIVLSIEGNEVLISSNLWEILDNILATLLRYIALSKFDCKKEKQKRDKIESQLNKITVKAFGYSGIFEISFCDNGKYIEEKKQREDLKDIIEIVEKSAGKVKITSHDSKNTIKFKFQNGHSLQSYIVFTSDEIYYALPIVFCEIVKEAFSESAITIKELIENNFSQKIKNKTNSINSSKSTQQIITINFNNKTLSLICDNIIDKVELAPKPPGNSTHNHPTYILSTTQLEENEIFILDIDELVNSVNINTTN